MAKQGLPSVPASVGEAIECLNGSEMLRAAFGSDVVDHYVHAGRIATCARRDRLGASARFRALLKESTNLEVVAQRNLLRRISTKERMHVCH